MTSHCMYMYPAQKFLNACMTRSRINVLPDGMFYHVSLAVDVTVHRKHHYVMLHSLQNLKPIVLHVAGTFLWLSSSH
jgi:hypothetical protein